MELREKIKKRQIYKKYLYAIIDTAKKNEFSFKGLGNKKVYTLPYQNISAVLSDFSSTNMVDRLNKSYIMSHELVTEKLMDDFTVLPVRFCTFLNTEESVVAMLKDYYNDFVSNLNRVKSKVELSVKVLWFSTCHSRFGPSAATLWRAGDGALAKKIRPKIVSVLETKQTGERESEGKRYMLKKLEEYAINKELEKEVKRYVDVIDGKFSKYASEKRLDSLKTEKLLLNASYLVEVDKVDVFKRAFNLVRAELKDLQFMLSGPWPAYNFIKIDRKNHLFRNF